MRISDLHDDLLSYILVRLPPECLGQLKIVSKSWNSLISSQKFIKSHLNQSRLFQKPNVLVPGRTEIKMVEFSITGDNMDLDEEDFDCKSKRLHCLPELLDERKIKQIVGSSNGLLCLLLSPEHDTICSLAKHDSCCFFDHYNFALCNPLTKSTWDLPGNQWRRLFGNESLYGFWYDDVNDDYKVVILNHVYYKGGIHEYECEVYSLRSNSWGKVRSYLDFSYDYKVSKYEANGVLVNCALHRIIVDDNRWKRFILAVDLRTYKPKILPLPKVEGSTYTLILTVLNGYLVLSNSHSSHLYNLWVMKDYGSNDSWMRITIHKSSVRGTLTPLFLLEDNNHKRILISYDSDDDMLELDDLDESDDVGSIRIRAPCSFFMAEQLEFVGSLVQPYPPSVGYEKISSDDRSENKVAAGDSMIKEQILNAPKFFKKFHIHVNGVSIDSQLPIHVRRKYYGLCCIKKSFLHERLVPGVHSKLAARMIIEAVNIADSIRSCKFFTSRDEIEKWGKSLRSLELLGMNIGFLRDRIRCLLRLAFDSEEAIEAKKYWEVKSEKARIEDKIEDLEKKLVELKKADKKYGAEVDALKPKAESYKLMFQVKIRKLL